MSKSRYVPALVVAFVLLALGLLAGPALIRTLPGRYAYYLPQPLQELRRNPHPETLPTSQPTIEPTNQPTNQPTNNTPTPLPPAPTHTPTPLPSTSTPFPTPTLTPTPPTRVTLTGLRHEHQGWNNCGPATLAMALSYWGRSETQYDVALVLKPDPEDKNVSLWEMEAYARELGLGAIVRVGGTIERLKALIRADLTVIVETWYVRDAHDQMGHYRLIVGYDDAAQEFLTYDSLHGPDVPIGYQELDELWRVFNRAYLVIYALEEQAALASTLGFDLYDAGMYERAMETARAEAASPPPSCVAYAGAASGECADWVTFSWFNIGSSLTSLGRHADAVAAYDQARQFGLHYRILWYQFGPYESYHAVGRHDDVIALANATLATTNNLEESYYWRGMSRLAQGDADGARADLETALHYHEGWPPAVTALAEIQNLP